MYLIKRELLRRESCSKVAFAAVFVIFPVYKINIKSAQKEKLKYKEKNSVKMRYKE